jgi:2-polyprenyl-3-methyl-5-hydroxy-6-metoxy-1,4-benzoquinol methylase
MAAGLGLDATGVDLAASALRAAERKARDRRLTARFLRRDARRLAHLGEYFDTVLDCGLFTSSATVTAPPTPRACDR